ncbi:hypothetical protein MMYC01_204789 [Madurella mycetomatis]|uniref:Uncharacterized protein n=1 Tax=Madurella mycetomatis TaxID=100816 RepID=A0A175W442_9PEZI|nr:hypothetical protein MMYC01_204789 [Madurella mycetomatis]
MPAHIVIAGSWCEILKSQTVGAFSSISNSFSRGSLTSQGTNSAGNMNGGSSNLGIATPAQETTREQFLGLAPEPCKADPTEGQNNFLTKSQSSSSPRLTALPDDPGLVTTAMTAQYWTGRFASLQDKFRNELLELENLSLLIEAHTDGSLHEPCASAVTRLIQETNLDSLSLNTDNNYMGPVLLPTRHIPKPATNEAIPKKAGYTASLFEPKARLPPLPTARTTTTTTTTTNLPRPRPRLGLNIHLVNHYRQGHHDAMAAAHNSSSQVEQKRKELKDLAIARADDTVVVRRALTHLGNLCLTREARESFTAWRVLHARKEGNSSLLPRGARMDDQVVFEERDQAQERRLIRVREREDGSDAFDRERGGLGKRGPVGARRPALVRRLKRGPVRKGEAGPSLMFSTLPMASSSSSFPPTVGKGEAV